MRFFILILKGIIMTLAQNNSVFLFGKLTFEMFFHSNADMIVLKSYDCRSHIAVITVINIQVREINSQKSTFNRVVLTRK